MRADDVVEALRRERASAIVRAGNQGAAAEAMEAAVRGGFRVVEFTLTTPGALELIADFARREGLVVGAGTVLDAEAAGAAVRAGARFLVSPVVDETVVAAAAALDVAAIPGACTPTELLRAHRAGAPMQKLFPAPAGGPAWLRSALGPLPFLRVVPTNGVRADNARQWLAAGAHALGFAAELFRSEDVERGDWDAVELRAKEILDQVRGA